MLASLKMSIHAGAGLLQWIRFLCSGNTSFLSLKYIVRIAFISVSSIFNSILGTLETILVGWRIRSQEINPDIVFILGHHRSGTTHLHNLISKDPRLGFVNTLQTFYPNSFFVMRPLCVCLKWVLGRTRPMDNVPIGFELPGEDEIAINILTGGISPYGAFSIMPRYEKYLKYLDFEECSEAELSEWQSKFLWFLRKCSYASGGKPLVLKSPTHTARIRILRELFPKAKFICIHREPKEVIASFTYLIQEYYTYCFLARTDSKQLTSYMFDHYKILCTSYNRYKNQIPEDQLVEVYFKNLEENPEHVLQTIYSHLGWEHTDVFSERVREYLSDLGHYQRNPSEILSQQLKKMVEATVCETNAFS